MNNINRLIFTVIFLTSCKFCKSENAKLTVELMNSGFHRFVKLFLICFIHSFLFKQKRFFFRRNLEYVIVFPDYQSKHHTFLIKQLLPASVYVSIDQLNDLYRFDKVNVITFCPSFFLIDFFPLNHFPFTVYIFTAKLLHRKWLYWYWKANWKIWTISYLFVWRHSILANHIASNTLSLSCTR